MQCFHWENNFYLYKLVNILFVALYFENGKCRNIGIKGSSIQQEMVKVQANFTQKL